MRRSKSTSDLLSLGSTPISTTSDSLSILGIEPPKPLPKISTSLDPGGLLQRAYLKRYATKQVIVKNIGIIKGFAEDAHGSMLLGYSQGSEGSMTSKIATTYKYSNSGQCFAYSLMYLRNKFEGGTFRDFATWLYSDTPEVDASNPLKYDEFDGRNEKLNTWMKRQFYPIARGAMYNVADYRGKLGPNEATFAAQLNTIEPNTELHSVGKYTLPAATKSLFGSTYSIKSPYSRVLAKIFSNYKHINDAPSEAMTLTAGKILKNQLMEHKITKAARKGRTVKRIASKAMHSFSMKDRSYTANKLTVAAVKEIGNYIEEAIFLNQLSRHKTHESFTTIGFHFKSGGGHVTALYTKGLANNTGCIEFFDSNYGIFRFEGHPSTSYANFYSFICRLIHVVYKDIDTMDINFFRS